MALTVTIAPAVELLDLDSAKQHLRVYDSDKDAEIAALIRAARDDCERHAGRTFRSAVTRAWTMDRWWSTGIVLPYPPLLTVTGITYYDTNNALQTLAAGNYGVETSTDGWGRIVWSSTATQPSVYDRSDAIMVTFTTGYTVDTLPPVALQAMKTRLTELWGAGTDSELKAADECTKRLLSKVDATSYA